MAAVMERQALAAAVLDDFASSSGLMGATSPRRYLWTDAFAAMTWTGLYERTEQWRYLDLALRMVAQVHEVLGAPRGGLRIGKPLPERGADEPYDPELEWDRDGQYYHYLTRWMHALQRAAAASRDERYRRWATDLAQAAHRAFAYPAGAPERLYWKMSIDLSRPLVPSMGAHDPLDGLVEAASLGLEREARDLARICDARRWATGDALGAGGLLLNALRLARLVGGGRVELQPLFARVMEDAALSAAAASQTLGGPAPRRLPFRELGFALGLHAVKPLAERVGPTPLERFLPLAAELEDFWLDAAHQSAGTWSGHRDINAVMLAACLAPQGVLG